MTRTLGAQRRLDRPPGRARGAATGSVALITSVVSTLTAGALLVVRFLRWERSVTDPLVPMRLFTNRDFALGNTTTFLMSGAIFAGGLLVTEELQLGRHYSPVGAGLHLLPFFDTPMLVSPLAGARCDPTARRPIAIT